MTGTIDYTQTCEPPANKVEVSPAGYTEAPVTVYTDSIGRQLREYIGTELDPAELCSTRPATFVPASADLYLIQHCRDAEPTIWLGKGESATGFRLTLAEATALVTTLSRLVAQVQS